MEPLPLDATWNVWTPPERHLSAHEPPRPTSIHMCHSNRLWRLHVHLNATHHQQCPFPSTSRINTPTWVCLLVRGSQAHNTTNPTGSGIRGNVDERGQQASQGQQTGRTSALAKNYTWDHRVTRWAAARIQQIVLDENGPPCHNQVSMGAKTFHLVLWWIPRVHDASFRDEPFHPSYPPTAPTARYLKNGRFSSLASSGTP
jgi:hypothetical protein